MQLDVRGNIDRVLASMDAYSRDVVAKAIPRALNRVGDMAATRAAREVKTQGYNFKLSEIKQAISLYRATAGRLVVTMRVRRKTKSLIEFDARESRDGVTVKVHGAKRLVKGAFIGQRQNGVSAVFVEDRSAGKIVVRRQKQYKRGSRGGWHDYPARKLYGPSVGGAYANERIQAIMREMMARGFEDRLKHEIGYLMSAKKS